MSLLAHLGPSERMIGVALNGLVQISVLVVMAALIAQTALRHRAGARHCLWLGALAWVLISPIVAILAHCSGFALWTLAIPLPGQGTTEAGAEINPDVASLDEIDPGGGVSGVNPRHRAPEPGGTSVPAETVVPDDTMAVGTQQFKARDPNVVNSVHPAAFRRGRALTEGISLLWMIGMLAGLARIVLGYRQLATVSRHARPIDLERHGETLALVCKALGVATLPPIVSTPAAREPVAIGLIRPEVVLPEGLTESLPSDSLGHILVHECAHIIRGDHWVGLLQRLAGALYWPHPLVHYLNGQLTRAREETCDNHVLRFADRYSYARTLLALTELCRPFHLTQPGLGLLTARWSLADRVAGLLDPRRVLMAPATYLTKISLAVALTVTGLTVSFLRLDLPARADKPRAGQPESPAVAQADLAAGAWRVAGTVVDERGQPVAGALVHSVPNDGVADEAKTGADGSFALTLEGHRPFIRGVITEMEGGARIGLFRFEGIRAPTAMDPVRITLRPSHPVRVRVKDAGGSPVPGAAVEAIDFSFQVYANTGPQGIATLQVPADAQVQWVIGLKSGVGFDYFENYRTKPATDFPPLPAEVTLTLDGAQTIRLKALDSKSQPVPGVVFSPWILLKNGKIDRANVGRSVILRATTDRDGMATFDWFPKDVSGGLFVIRSGPYTCPDPPRHERGGPTDLTFRLLRNAVLSGVVRFPDGRPAPRVLIRALGSPARMTRGIPAARTGKDGRYSLEVPSEAAYMIGVDDETWAAQSLPNLVVREGQSQAGLDIRLTKGTLLHGQVTEGPDRRLSAGAQVSLVEEDGLPPKDLRHGMGRKVQLVRRSITDPQGRYHFRVAPGRYWLMAPPLSGNESLMVEVNAEAEIVRDMVLGGSARQTFFSGVVIESTPAGERPLAQARVYNCGVGTSGGSSLTDAGGRFRMLRTPGEHILYAIAENGLAGFTPLDDKADDVKVIVSQTTTVSGRVIDSDGKPLPRQRVGVALASGRLFFLKSLYFRFGINTDERGGFMVKGAPVGSVGELSVFHRRDVASTTPRTAVKFEIPDLAPVEVPDLIVPPENPKK